MVSLSNPLYQKFLILNSAALRAAPHPAALALIAPSAYAEASADRSARKQAGSEVQMLRI